MSRPTTPPPSGPLSIPKPSSDPLSSPPRSNTHHHHKPSRPHIPHQPHRTHRHHHTDSNPQQVPQSAITGPSSHHTFGDFLSKTKSSLADPFPAGTSSLVGLGGSRTPPRTGDVTGLLDVGGERDGNSNSNTNPNNINITQAKREEEERERKQRKKREAEQQQQKHQQEQKQKWTSVSHLRHARTSISTDLRTTLAQLSTLSTTTTRRLDYTYYALLSSLSNLRSGISSLSTLADETRQLGTHFRAQTKDVRTETEAVVERAEEHFRRQGGRIEVLEGRLRRGRERVRGLGGRLEGVREWFDGIGEGDGGGRRGSGSGSGGGSSGRRRRRTMMTMRIWRMGCGCVVGFMVLGVLGWAWLKGGSVGVGVEDRKVLGGRGGDGNGNGNGTFWEVPMKEGTLGAEGLKTGLESLRGPSDSSNESVFLNDEMAPAPAAPAAPADAVEGGGARVEEEDKEEKQNRDPDSRIDAEATLRLFDEL